jgi:hypothetical protein
MQEEVLSTRLLFFIDGQLFFRCARDSYSEALNWGNNPLRHLPHPASLYNEIFADEVKGADFFDFSMIVMYYTSRNLTFDRDILRAAQGMLRKYSILSDLHCFEGMCPPLDRSMLFEKTPRPLSKSFGRRKGLPSYSWSGWHHVVMWRQELENFEPETFTDDTLTDHDLDPNDKNFRTWILWYCRVEDGRLYRISNRGRLRKAAILPTPELGRQNSRPSWQDLPVSVTDLNLRDIRPTTYPVLLFSTVVINLKLRRRLRDPAHHDLPDNLLDFDVLTTYDDVCGLVDVDTPLSVTTTEAQFALMAATGRDVFWALMLKWEEGIAERRGIVKLEMGKGGLSNALPPGPRWKMIVLG